jgi:hypothetical protein
MLAHAFLTILATMINDAEAATAEPARTAGSSLEHCSTPRKGRSSRPSDSALPVPN